jgi:hypothetical protein
MTKESLAVAALACAHIPMVAAALGLRTDERDEQMQTTAHSAASRCTVT